MTSHTHIVNVLLSAVGHTEQPFETPAGYPRRATKIQKVGHEVALAACRFTTELKLVGLARQARHDAIANTRIDRLERNATVRRQAAGQLRIRDQSDVRARLQVEPESVQLIDCRAIGHDLVERFCRGIKTVESGRPFGVAAWEQACASAKQQASAQNDDAAGDHAI